MTNTEQDNKVIDDHGVERGKTSCTMVKKMLCGRPWVIGEVVETIINEDDDRDGVDLFALVDRRLTDIMCMEQGERGIKVQVKSSLKKEKKFFSRHKEVIFNLATGENIFVLNGQDDFSLMMASLIGQMVVMADLTGTVSEEVLLGFIADDMGDPEAVQAYLSLKEYLIEDDWCARMLRNVSVFYGQEC